MDASKDTRLLSLYISIILSFFESLLSRNYMEKRLVIFDMIKKTFAILYASNVPLTQQYREKGSKKYYELISHFLVAKKNNDLLMKNHAN